jgi:hypothetical protein
MRIRGTLVVLVSSLGLVACGGASANGDGAKGPDPWADFKGTYASPGESRGTSSMAKGERSRHDAKAKAEAKAPEEEAPPARKSSRGTIHGESLSAIGVDALADAARGALKSKVVSSNVTVGAEYEQVLVQLKGASVRIIRPASSPDPNGAAVSSPKTRSAELSKAESGWYDEEADVLVLVDAGRKTAAQRALSAILKR